MTSKIVTLFNSYFYEFIKLSKSIVKKDDVALYNLIREKFPIKETNSINIDSFDKLVTSEFLSSLLLYEAGDKVPQIVLDSEIVNGFKISMIINDTSMQSIMSYVLIFTVLTVIHRKNMSNEGIEEFIDILSTCQKGEDSDKMGDIMDEDLVSLLSKIKELSSHDTGASAASASSGFEEALANSSIGSIAKDIAKEIDIDSLNIKKPEDMFSAENSQFIGDIVTKVTSSLHKKMQNGSLNQEKLMGEAMNLFSSMNGGPSGDMLSEMMKNMSKSFGGGNRHSGPAARSRLSKKLADRKKGTN